MPLNSHNVDWNNLSPVYTRETILKLDLTGEKDTATCQHCGQVLVIPFPFYPYKVFNGKQNILIKTRGQLLQNFIEKHYGSYMLSLQGKR